MRKERGLETRSRVPAMELPTDPEETETTAELDAARRERLRVDEIAHLLDRPGDPVALRRLAELKRELASLDGEGGDRDDDDECVARDRSVADYASRLGVGDGAGLAPHQA